MERVDGAPSISASSPEGAKGSRPGQTFLATCLRCKSELTIIDDLPPSSDFAHSFRGSLGESFVVVPTTDTDEPRQQCGTPLSDGQLHVASSDEVSRVEKIMALASGQCDIDYPVCGSCLQHVVAEVQRRVDLAGEEHHIYREAHKRLEQDLEELGREDPAELEREIAELEAEEQRLLDELKAFDREEHELQEELERHRRQEAELNREEEEFWLGVAAHQLDLAEIEDERAATASGIQYATSELNRLKRTNVLNEMFHISHEGEFGTINGLRLGRLPGQPVQWEEINAAWGQACLLLDALVKKCGVTTQYRLLPRGNYSAIQHNNDVLDLHNGEVGLGRFFSDRKYDLAMTAFLGCLHEVTRLLQRDPNAPNIGFKKIENDKIGNFSVRYQFNQESAWTKALKFMIMHLKLIIGFVEGRSLPPVGDRS